MDKNKELKLIKDDGTEISCEVLFTYFSEEYNKNYVIFEIPGEEMLSAASFETNEDGTTGEIVFIEDAKEWEMLEEVVEDYYENADDEDESEGCHCGNDCDCEDECDCDGDCDCDDDCDCDNDCDCEDECDCDGDCDCDSDDKKDKKEEHGCKCGCKH